MLIPESKKNENLEEDQIEVRLSDIVQFLKDSRSSALISSLILLILGTVYAFSRADQYSVQVTVMPEIQSKPGGLGGLSSLAGLAGIDISSASGGSYDAIRPDIYSDILQSVPFALQLLQQPVYSRMLEKETSLQDFIEEQGKHSLLYGMTGSHDSSDEASTLDPKNRSKTLQITEKQEILINQIHNAVSTTFDRKTGIVTVTATLTDPIVAATVARLSLEYLTNYITSYRTENARRQVRFLARQLEEVKTRYRRAEYALSNFKDQNRNIYLNTAKIEEQRLQSDFLLTQNVFNELSKQIEQAKIKVAEESPVFKILEPARIPLKKSAPRRSLLIVGFTFAGFFLGVLIHGVRRFIH